jgi:hypothetical protein
MKRAIIASILGIAASVATMRGQGSFELPPPYGGAVWFSTYFSSSAMAYVRYAGNGGIVGPGFTAELYYGLGSDISFSSTRPSPKGTAVVGKDVPGLIIDGPVFFNDYTGGPITFAIVAYDGTGWNNGTSTCETSVADVWTWTEPSISTFPEPYSQFTWSILSEAAAAAGKTFDGLPYISVGIPEPGALALAGLGAAAMLILRKRQ